MMEISAASGASLADSFLVSGKHFVGLKSATIPAAVILTASPHTGPSLLSRVDIQTGALELAALTKGQTQGELYILNMSFATFSIRESSCCSSCGVICSFSFSNYQL